MYKIGICDDNLLVCNQLEQYLFSYANKHALELKIEVFLTGEKLLEYLQKQEDLDLLFLDIEFDGINGVEVGECIRTRMENHAMQIVYISAKENYALELFKIRPFHFLIKPITESTVTKVMETYQKIFDSKPLFFEYQIGKSKYRLLQSKIIYFQCIGKKVEIVTEDEHIAFYGSMRQVSRSLSKNHFCVIHKSFIVNLSYVVEFSIKQVILINGDKLPISQAFRRSVRERILTDYMERR